MNPRKIERSDERDFGPSKIAFHMKKNLSSVTRHG